MPVPRTSERKCPTAEAGAEEAEAEAAKCVQRISLSVKKCDIIDYYDSEILAIATNKF